MAERRWLYLLPAALVLLLAVGLYAYQTGLIYALTPGPNDYERVTVTAYDGNGTPLATVDARVADTREKRYVGLSDTRSLPAGEGMLFVHGSEGRHSYVMRDMSFPLDMIFVAANETVTTVHHAPVPEGDYERSYTGRAKWVLEVPRGWANRTGLDEGDRIAVP